MTAARARSYPTREAAEAGKRDGELVMCVKRSDGELEWGVVPAEVVIDQGEGREPVRQPVGDFLANWWTEIEDQVRRERGVG